VTVRRFPFAIDDRAALPLRVFGVREATAEVVLDEVGLTARFGRFRVRTPWDNVRDASVSGPFRWYRAIGPRLSLSDRGVTFGSTATAGTCIRFHEPVAALFGHRRVHPGLTVTVRDSEGLAVAIAEAVTAHGRA
jgi:hypothetical protein